MKRVLPPMDEGYIADRLAEIAEWGFTHVATKERAEQIAEAARREGMRVRVHELRHGWWEVEEA